MYTHTMPPKAMGMNKAVAHKPVKRRRPKKDPSAPKRSLSAYMFFAMDEREKILSKHPDLRTNVSQVGKLIGEAWNKLSEDEKIPYAKKAADDKIRYENEKKIYLGKA